MDDRLTQLFGADRRRLRTGAAVVLVLVALAVAVLVSAMGSAGTTVAVPDAPAPAVSSRAAPTLLVHVLGAVRAPGLYSLPDGSRVVDAVAAAGGLADDADAGGINLARRVADGEQLAVPRVGEEAPVPTGPGRVDLNTATAEELDTLPGIGPALAARILDWREEHGGFASADDLLEVPGLGEKTVAELRELVLP